MADTHTAVCQDFGGKYYPRRNSGRLWTWRHKELGRLAPNVREGEGVGWTRLWITQDRAGGLS